MPAWLQAERHSLKKKKTRLACLVRCAHWLLWFLWPMCLLQRPVQPYKPSQIIHPSPGLKSAMHPSMKHALVITRKPCESASSSNKGAPLFCTRREWKREQAAILCASSPLSKCISKISNTSAAMRDDHNAYKFEAKEQFDTVSSDEQNRFDLSNSKLIHFTSAIIIKRIFVQQTTE